MSLPLNFHEWAPPAQATLLGLLTFLQEDVPTVSAALLAAAGSLPWQIGLPGCFLGIWIGDALLYLMARGVGRPLLRRSWAKRFFDPAAVARSEQWFARKGVWLLLGSRFLPGTRLPTYLAAGFLRLHFGQFLLVTGIAVAAWTVGIFLLAQTVGPGLLGWLRRWNTGAWAIVVLVAALIIAIRLSLKCFRRGELLRVLALFQHIGRRIAATCGRWTRWEFWPVWLFYTPVVLNYFRLSIRYGSFTLPTAANPGIFSGGIVGESKFLTLQELHATSPDFTAEAFLIEGPTSAVRFTALRRMAEQHRLDYPLILKPDVGQRGVGVKLIRTPDQAAEYLRQTRAAILIQRYVPGPHELGIFYYRFPHQSQGRIFAITEKIFPIVVGDGQRTIEELVWNDARARFIAAKYLHRFHQRRKEVLSPGEMLKLVEAGNHAQGCIFRDGAHLWSEALERSIDNISQRLQGFFIGRYDIRYSSEHDLRAGRGFSIIELNGAASEATNIYDARNSILAAYRTLFRQWELVFAIGAANRRTGSSPTKLTLLWRKWRETTALIATYPP